MFGQLAAQYLMELITHTLSENLRDGPILAKF